mmetsp:Transcript_10219/g.25954  ORF Transcript_10219/g.25954 Transcript_10219/m.25954 type:complete len:874 (+) Transcript_10219:56-2677(+)
MLSLPLVLWCVWVVGVAAEDLVQSPDVSAQLPRSRHAPWTTALRDTNLSTSVTPAAPGGWEARGGSAFLTASSLSDSGHDDGAAHHEATGDHGSGSSSEPGGTSDGHGSGDGGHTEATPAGHDSGHAEASPGHGSGGGAGHDASKGHDDDHGHGDMSELAHGNSPGDPECIVKDNYTDTLAFSQDCPEGEKQKFAHHYKLRRIAGVFLALSVVMMTILFEHATHVVKEYLISQNSLFATKLFNQVLQELAILGFVALCFFAFSRLGGFDWLNDIIFGTKVVEHHEGLHPPWEGHTIPELGVMFEQLHFVLFNIMVLYIGTFMWLFWIVRRAVRIWRIWEQVPPDQIVSLYKAGSKQKLAGESVANIMQFYTFRREILSPCDDPYWLEDKAEVQVSHSWSADFPMSDYLKDVLGTRLLRMVALPKKSLLLLCVTSVLTNSLKTAELKATALAFNYWMLSLPLSIWSICIIRKINRIYSQMTPPLDSLVWNESSKKPPPVPPYRQEHVVLPTTRNRFWLWWCGTGNPTHHEALFWGWAHGPKTLARSIQSCLFFTIILWGSWIESLKEHSQYWKREWYAVVFMFIPGVVLFASLPWTISKFGIITSIRDFLDADTVVIHSKQAHQKRLARELMAYVVSSEVTWAAALPEDRKRAESLWRRMEHEGIGPGKYVDLATAHAALNTVFNWPYAGPMPEKVQKSAFIEAALIQIKVGSTLGNDPAMVRMFDQWLGVPEIGCEREAARRPDSRRGTRRSQIGLDTTLPGIGREALWIKLGDLESKEEIGEAIFAHARKKKIVGKDVVLWIRAMGGKIKVDGMHGGCDHHKHGNGSSSATASLLRVPTSSTATTSFATDGGHGRHSTAISPQRDPSQSFFF